MDDFSDGNDALGPRIEIRPGETVYRSIGLPVDHSIPSVMDAFLFNANSNAQAAPNDGVYADEGGGAGVNENDGTDQNKNDGVGVEQHDDVALHENDGPGMNANDGAGVDENVGADVYENNAVDAYENNGVGVDANVGVLPFEDRYFNIILFFMFSKQDGPWAFKMPYCYTIQDIADGRAKFEVSGTLEASPDPGWDSLEGKDVREITVLFGVYAKVFTLSLGAEPRTLAELAFAIAVRLVDLMHHVSQLPLANGVPPESAWQGIHPDLLRVRAELEREREWAAEEREWANTEEACRWEDAFQPWACALIPELKDTCALFREETDESGFDIDQEEFTSPSPPLLDACDLSGEEIETESGFDLDQGFTSPSPPPPDACDLSGEETDSGSVPDQEFTSSSESPPPPDACDLSSEETDSESGSVLDPDVTSPSRSSESPPPLGPCNLFAKETDAGFVLDPEFIFPAPLPLYPDLNAELGLRPQDILLTQLIRGPRPGFQFVEGAGGELVPVEVQVETWYVHLEVREDCPAWLAAQRWFAAQREFAEEGAATNAAPF